MDQAQVITYEVFSGPITRPICKTSRNDIGHYEKHHVTI